MTHTDGIIGRKRSIGRSALTLSVLGLLGLFGLLSPSFATAAEWSLVKNFAPLLPQPANPPSWPEDVQLGGVGGMAVNVNGAGEVPPGTVYTIGASGQDPWHVARYSAEGTFELAWTTRNRCGPKADPPSACPTYPSASGGGIDVAVDQKTGNVYVFNKFDSPFVVHVYKPDGTGPISEFGERDPTGSVAASPEKLHESPLNENIAVADDGTVYVVDEATNTDQLHRLMVFEPQTPGDYEHYVYAGKARDIAAGPLGSGAPFRPAVDDEGNIFVSSETAIKKYDPDQPATPICSFDLLTGGITAFAVNPATGAVFYYAWKPKPEIHQLSPCNAQGQFVEAGPSFTPTPRRAFLEGMTFNPTGQLPGLAPGILYAAAGEECPAFGACPPDAKGQSSIGYIFATSESPPKPPLVVSESATRVGASTATLNAGVNPNGAQTNYAFQYITDAAYQANEPSDPFAGASVAPAFGSALGSGQQPLLASATIGGLSPATVYHYRVVATNEAGLTFGPDAVFQTFASEVEGLPDNRAYELVSPSNKNGGEVLPAAPNTASCGDECKPGLAGRRYPIQVRADGGGIAYQGQPFYFNEGSSEYDEYVATRSPSGWQNRSMSPPLVGTAGAGVFEAFKLNSELSRGLTYATNQALTPEAPIGYLNFFSQPTANRFDLTPLLITSPPNRPSAGSEGFKVNFVGASADLSHVFFEANDALTGPTVSAPSAVDGGPDKTNLYEWSDGQLHLVNVQPGNLETIPGAAFGSGRSLANPSVKVSNFSHAISDDGSVVFWSSESGQVYVRENGQQTREIPDHNGKFLSAATDGSKVLLSDGVIYDLQSGSLTDLTGGSGGFEGLVGQSDDLSSVYFVANSILTGAANERGAVAEAGKDNLYAWREGTLRFVGTLLATDNPQLGVWEASPVQRAAEASPSGRWLAFNSVAPLTDANTIGACEFSNAQQKYVGSVPCEEVYLYDFVSESLRCVSCNPTGAPPLGGSFLRIMMNAPGSLEQPRYLTDDGRLYFDSRDALSSLDTNSGVEDVYQYEPAGVGSCVQSGGCVSLISTGRGSSDSNLLAIDPSGANVFFTTRQKLVPRDQDNFIDLYDARVGGGLAADYPAPPSVCLGEGCQSPSPPPPSEPNPSSSTFQGSGNLKPTKARKKHHKKKHRKGQKNKKNGNAKNARGGSK